MLITTPSSYDSSLIGNSDGLISYINSIQKFPMLSAEEEEMLAQSWYSNKCVENAHKLVTSHLRLVVKIAMNFKNYGLPILELIMEGNIGLMQAVKKYNPNLGFRLSTYAIWWIKALIKDYILKSWSFVKIGTTAAQRKLFFSLRKIKKRLSDYGSPANNCNVEINHEQLIAEECSVSIQEVRDMEKRLSMRDKSLNSPVFLGDSTSNVELQDIIPSVSPNQESIYLAKEESSATKVILNEALNLLNERHRNIFINRKLISIPKTLDELSKKYNISKERVRQIEKQSLDKVKPFIQSRLQELGYQL